MSLLSRALRGAGLEQRQATSGLANPEAWLTDTLVTNRSYSGRTVSVASSLQLIPVWAAVRMKASAVGSLPLIVYKRLDQGRVRAADHWMWPLLHDQPNPVMPAGEFWQIVSANLDLWGNFFAYKERGTLGSMVKGKLWPIRPDRVQVHVEEDGSRLFIIDGDLGRPYTADEVLHIRGFSTDGVVGLSPIQQAKNGLGVIGDMEEFAGRFYGQGAINTVVLKHPNRLSKDAAETVRRTARMKMGAKNVGDPVVLQEGMDIDTISMPLEDAQFIETQRYNLLQVALLIGVPPKSLGASTGDSLTYTSAEWESLDFVRWSLTSTLSRIEGALTCDPSLFVQGQRFYPEFLVDALLRGTTKERYEAYQIALDPATGWMTREEIRDRENLPPTNLPALPAQTPAAG